MPQDSQKSSRGRAKTGGQDPAIPASSKRLFSSAELRLFRYTAVVFALVALAALIGVIVWTFGWMLSVFYSLLLSLATAGVLALVLHPIAVFLERRLQLPHLLAISLVILAFFVGIGGLLFFLVPLVVSQALQLMTVLPDTLASWQAYLSFHFPELTAMITSSLENSGGEESQSALPGIKNPGTKIMSYLGLLAAMAFMPLFLFFALLSGNLLRGQVSELLSVFRKPTQRKTLYFMDVFVEYVTAFFQGQLIIAVCMGTLYAIGFTLIGLDFGVLIGLVLGLLNIVPFLGSLIGLLVVLPMSYLQPEGGAELLVLAGLVFATVQLIESWLLTPKIMANRSGLHPALVVISLFFWGIALGGVIGLILAVPLTAFVVAIWSEIKASLIHTLSSADASAKRPPDPTQEPAGRQG